MHVWTDHEIGRLHREEIRQEVAIAHLEKALRTDRKRGSGLGRDLRWEIARYVGLLGKRFRRSR